MTEVEKLMKKFGDDTIKLMQDELRKGGKADSRFIKLMKSYVTEKEKEIILTIEMPDYGIWIDQGRTPGKPGPPKGALLDWMRRKGIPAKRESFIQKRVGIKGIKAVPFLYIWHDRMRKLKKDFGISIKKDIEVKLAKTAEKISDK